MLNAFPEHPEKALHGKIGRSFSTCATEWETSCFSGTMAAPVTSGVSFEEKMITSLVVLEDNRCNISVSSDIACFTKVPCPPSASLAAPCGALLFFFALRSHVWKVPHWVSPRKKPSLSKGRLRVLFSQGDVTRPVKPQKKGLTFTERVVKMAERWTDTNLFHAFFAEEHCHDILKLPNCLLLKKETLRRCRLQGSVVTLHSVSGFKSWRYIRILLQLSLSLSPSSTQTRNFSAGGMFGGWLTGEKMTPSRAWEVWWDSKRGLRDKCRGCGMQSYDGGLEGRFSVEFEPVLVIFKKQQLSIVSIQKFSW